MHWLCTVFYSFLTKDLEDPKCSSQIYVNDMGDAHYSKPKRGSLYLFHSPVSSTSTSHVWYFIPLITFSLSFPCSKPAIMCPQPSYQLQRLWKWHRNDRLIFVFSAAILSCLSPSKPQPLLPLMTWTQLKITVRETTRVAECFALVIINYVSTVNKEEKTN